MLIGLDIGGTKTEAVVLDAEHRTRGRALGPTASETPLHLIEGAVRTIQQALQEAGVSHQQVEQIGVGIPGQVEPETGEVRLAVNLNLTAYPLGAAFRERLGVPCHVENDVRTAAVGAHRSIHPRTVRNMAYVNIGTGVSAGLILDGRLFRGAHGMAGEIGHMVIEPMGVRCNCGLYGCLETLISGPAIARLGQEAIVAGEATLLRDTGAITAITVYEAAAQGDTVAKRITARAGQSLAQALQGLVMAYDVEQIVLGGGVTRAGVPFLTAIQEGWAAYRQQSPLAEMLLRPEMLSLADPQQNMVAYGAALLATEAWEMGQMTRNGPHRESASGPPYPFF